MPKDPTANLGLKRAQKSLHDTWGYPWVSEPNWLEDDAEEQYQRLQPVRRVVLTPPPARRRTH